MAVARHPRPHGLGASSKHLSRLAGQNQPPLMGFVSTPLHRCHQARLRRRRCCHPPVSKGHLETRSVLVVSHHLDGSHRARLASILQPATDHGVRHVSCARPADHLPKQSRRNRRNPHDAVRTLRRIPLVRSRTASPQPLPSCRSLRILESPKRLECTADPNGLRSTEMDPHTSGRSTSKCRTGTSSDCDSQSVCHQTPGPRSASATGLSSTDESVTSCRRCQRNDVLSFHGLCSPSRYLQIRSTPVERTSSAISRHEAVRDRRKAPVRPGNTANRVPDQHAWGAGHMATAETVVNGASCGNRTMQRATGRNQCCSRIGRTTVRWSTGIRFGRIPS